MSSNFDSTKKAIVVANITAVLLVIIKTVVGIMSGSLALLSSALDSTLDFFVSLFNLYVIKTSNDKDNSLYNYGKGKIQGIGAVLEGAIVGFSGITLIYFAIRKIIDGGAIESLNESIYVMIASIILTGALVIYLSKVAKKTKNLTIRADMLHYTTDLYTNIGIIISLVLIKFSGLVIIDSIVAIVIGIYILTSSKGIITEGYHMLMDRKLDQEILDKVIDIILNTDKRVNSYHYLNSRKSGDDIFIDFHLVFDKDISLFDAHNTGDMIELKIKEILENAKVLIHLDPYDDSKGKIYV
ncbi:cation diffusion facilitator family transporter [Candidatus Gracilibacteria bacterium]|nr:cation diffusion facilitator family transporter [Candidatus Gracilibacteria bacterium]